jgi:uncharacterized protein (TIGR02246 family)
MTRLCLTSIALFLSALPALAQNSDDIAAITGTLDAYESALNAADTAAIVALYTEDGVQMAPDFPAAVGSDAIAASYAGTFQAITLTLDFTIDDITLLAPDVAVLRSHSTGTLAVNGAADPAGPAAFKELFLLRQDGEGDWRFTHYSFSSVFPQ